MKIDNESKVIELLEIYKDDIAELKSKRGTGFPITEARHDTEIAYKEMFIKDLERAINSKSKLQRYYWRKKKEHLVWFEKIEDSYLIRFKFSGEIDYSYTLGEIGSAPIKLTETEACDLLKDDFDKFEKVECE